MSRRPLKDIDALMGPKRVAEAKSMARKKMKRMFLREVRKQLGLTQAKLAKAMGVSQSALSQLESQDDMQLSTLRRLVHAMGGHIDVVLHLDNRLIVLSDAKP
jgi:DNA-binding XRE family transcriptional regulator